MLLVTYKQYSFVSKHDLIDSNGWTFFRFHFTATSGAGAQLIYTMHISPRGMMDNFIGFKRGVFNFKPKYLALTCNSTQHHTAVCLHKEKTKQNVNLFTSSFWLINYFTFINSTVVHQLKHFGYLFSEMNRKFWICITVYLQIEGLSNVWAKI